MIPSSSAPTAGIVLAAGMSTRFGSPKQLIEIDHLPLVCRALQHALFSDLDQVVLVLGYAKEKIMISIHDLQYHEKLKIVYNQHFKHGMATSLQAGMQEIKECCASVMFLLADQPFIDEKIINILLNRFRHSNKDICVPVIREARANPTLFSRQFYEPIMTLKGDEGARKLIEKNRNHVHYVLFEEENKFIDIDNMKDLTKVENLLKSEMVVYKR